MTAEGVPTSKQSDKFFDGETGLLDDIAQRAARQVPRGVHGNGRSPRRVLAMHETAMTALGAGNDKSGAFERADHLTRLYCREGVMRRR